MLRRIGALFLLLVSAGVAYFALAWVGTFGRLPGPGEIAPARRPAAEVSAAQATQRRAAEGLGAPARQILFGDLHVHTTYSVDAFLRSLPILQGEGAHPPADACDFARFCSGLDFFAITDHAEGISPDLWSSTIESLRQCDAMAAGPGGPDLVPFLGFEWTNINADPALHYGHKNVIFRELDAVPTRPIAALGAAFDGMRQTRGAGAMTLMAALDFGNRQTYFNFDHVRALLRQMPVCEEGVDVHELPLGCAEAASTPRVLFEKLAQWGLPSLVIPHGNAWGNTTPAGVRWDKQLRNGNHDPERQRLIEVYSGHGNSEEYRSFAHGRVLDDGSAWCPEPTDRFTASCWRAGEIIRERCAAQHESERECDARAQTARENYVRAAPPSYLTIPGQTPEDWLESGQCRDCFEPAFDLRPGGTAQYALSLDASDLPDQQARRFRFGFIASSDNHTARAGSGYKEVAPTSMSDTYPQAGIARRARLLPDRGAPEARSRAIDPARVLMLPGGNAERTASFYYTGGLVAVHAAGRERGAIWNALERREVYGTSGPRILLWFDLLNAPTGQVPMGSEVEMHDAPRFRVRAAGALHELPGCPGSAESALAPERLEALCRGECHHPSDQRHAITRIEVVRIRPGAEGDPAARIEDPLLVLPCVGSAGCEVEFDDPDFAQAGRDSVYYVRAIQEPTPQINGQPLVCERDASGACLRVTDRCQAEADGGDDCLGMAEARAWSSPIFVDVSRGVGG